MFFPGAGDCYRGGGCLGEELLVCGGERASLAEAIVEARCEGLAPVRLSAGDLIDSVPRAGLQPIVGCGKDLFWGFFPLWAAMLR